MIFALFNILLVFADSKVSSASSASASSVSNSSKSPSTSAPKEVKSTAVNVVTSTSAVVSQKASTTVLNSKEICVQCYDKEIRTPDCKECNCECKCDKGRTRFKKSDSDNACPKVDLSQVPCECKENGMIRVDKSYKPKPDDSLALGISN